MRSVFVRFCIMQGAFWSFQAVFPGYLAAYLMANGFSASVWGILQALNLLFCLLGSLFWGAWIDRHQASRRFYLLSNAAVGLLGILIYLSSGMPLLTFFLYPLFGLMNGPIATTLDAWVIATFPENPDAGPQSRSYATLCYAIVMLLSGQLISAFGYYIMPIGLCLFLCISIFTAVLQPEIRPEMETISTSRELNAHASMRRKIQELFGHREYVLLALAMLFIAMCNAPINNMKVVVFRNVGGDIRYLGWDSFIGCMCQLPFLTFSRQLRRFRAESRLLLGILASIIYAGLISLARTPNMVIVATIMANVNFGLLFPAMREITENSTPHALRNSAHSVIDVAYGSLAGMISCVWSGYVIDNFGTASMARIAMCIGLVSLGFAFLIAQRAPKQIGHIKGRIPAPVRIVSRH